MRRWIASRALIAGRTIAPRGADATVPAPGATAATPVHRAFTPHPKEQGHGGTLHEQAVRLYLAGMSQRAIGRLLGVVRRSIANWVSDATPTEAIEVDELYTFVGRKKGRPSSSSRSRARVD